MRIIETISHKLSSILEYNENQCRIIDIITVYACKFGRLNLHKTYRAFASYEIYASKKEFYYGFKIHSLIALDGYITDFTLTYANKYGIQCLC